MQTVTSDVAASEDLPLKAEVMVSSVGSGSSSSKAGLKVKDIITHFREEEVLEATQLITALWQYQIGDEVTVVFQRENTKMEVVINLSIERPQ